MIPVTPDDLQHLMDTIETDKPTRSDKAGFRWSQSRELKRGGVNETTIVWCQQTVPVTNSPVIVDLEGSSIRLVVHHGRAGEPLRITSARLTTFNHPGLRIDAPKTFDKLDPGWADELPEDIAVELLAPVLGFPGRSRGDRRSTAGCLSWR